MSSIATGSPYENESKSDSSAPADGARRWHLVRGLPIYNAKGELEHWFGTCTDIDDFKRASEELAALNQTLERQSRDFAPSSSLNPSTSISS